MATPDVPAENRIFQIHYSSVLPMLISFSYRLFGVSEWSTRLVPAAASLASVFLVMLLGRELISFRVGIMAGILMAVTPMFIYYGKNPVHEVVLLPFALLSFYSYQRFRQTNKEKWWKILLISLVSAMLIGWSGYYAVGLIFLHGILFQPKARAKFFQLPLVAAALLAIFLFHASILSLQAAGELQNIFFARLGGASISLVELLRHEIRFAVNLFTAALLGLTAVWGIWIGMLKTQGKLKQDNILLAFVGLFGIAHALVFRQAAWYHEYLLFPLLPFISIVSAAAIQRVISQLRPGMAQLIGIVMIILLVFSERLPYAKALLASEYVRDVYQEAVEYGKIVQSRPGVVVPVERDVYFVFYADTVRNK